jgi:uncharacterized delta-60 repeat protein
VAGDGATVPSPRRAAALVLFALAFALSASPALAGPLDLDPSFGTGGFVTTGDAAGGRWAALHVFGDGSFLAAGEVGNDRVAVTRRTASGAPDTTFAADQPVPGTLAFGGGQGAIIARDLDVLPDGRILVAATAQTATGGTAPGIVVARLTADGHLDATFGSGGIATVTTAAGGVTLGHMARQPSGAIVLAGTHPVTSPAGILARLTPDGAVDGTFGSAGQSRVLIGGAATRLDDVAVDAAGRLVVTGWRAIGGASAKGRLVVARFAAADGAADTTYGTAGSCWPPTAARPSPRRSPPPAPTTASASRASCPRARPTRPSARRAAARPPRTPARRTSPTSRTSPSRPTAA